MMGNIKEVFEDDLNRTENVDTDTTKGVFVAMQVINAEEVVDWYKKQGIDTINPIDLHVTIIYSKKHFTAEIESQKYIEIKPEDMEMHPSVLGDNCIVVRIKNNELDERLNKYKLAGGTSDYPEYLQHFTISYNTQDLDLSKVVRPDFNILLGNEYSNPLQVDYIEKIKKY